jgi:ABC-2 type transport system ATP-binding protein
MTEPILSARALSRRYRKRVKAEGLLPALKNLVRPEYRAVQAVAGFDLRIESGEMVGLIGPNGAGKTSLVKLLAGLMKPDSGELSVLGFRPIERKSAFLGSIALVMGQKSQLWPDVPARDSFRLNQAVYGLSEADYAANLGRLTAALDAGALLDTPVRNLSLGERMRVEFIAALLHGPALAFLDEPTIGLDAPAQRRIREFLAAENRRRGLTVLLTSHYMDDVRKLCPRSVLILDGRKAYDGPTEAMLAGATERQRIRVSLEPPSGAPKDSAPDPQVEFDAAAGFPFHVELLERGEAHFVLGVAKADAKAALRAVFDRFPVTGVAVEDELAEAVERLYAAGGAE